MALAHYIQFHAAADGYRLAARVWPARNPVARVVFLHGIISHGGWYARTCDRLAEAGCEVHFLDRRGSGLNAERRGDVDRWETWLTDVEGYLAALPDDRPRVLCGISWGGKVVSAVARRRPDLLSRIALIGPGLFAHQSPGFAKRLAIRLANAIGLSERRVVIPLEDPALFTDEPAWREYVRLDPLTLRQVTIRFAREDQRLTRFATESPSDIRTPTLLLLAGRDRIVRNDDVEEFCGRIQVERRTVILSGAAHTFEFEPDPSEYWRELEQWCGVT